MATLTGPMRRRREAPLWLKVQEQGSGEEVVGADEWMGRVTDRQGSASASTPWDRARQPCPPPGRAGYVGVRNMGLWLGIKASMMIKVEKYIYITAAAKKMPCFSFFPHSSASAYPAPFHTRFSTPYPRGDAFS